ncbi:ParB/RepB/Spo0J family partition protein [Aureimonas jatrophae]|uniref:Chromosome segregation DNA-binding protein n=1 Tax=Aureimonas jatrophae TaxID=1166073 RepID=A0A1H0K775_9HYPH|nr:ParB/RepB/Spo0J family partition protein [Aureimonas jatrophae]MBB3950980.1 ParB family chromosome partitioning protein [Aureimonas jatrophae]SDO51739.1 chromosome segregation DNA-binding protein [Aureimonas jatrophae]
MNDDKGRQRLGRGLASLIGGAPTSAAPPRTGAPALPSLRGSLPPGERRVSTADLDPNPRNPRKTFHEADLAELTDSVRRHGVVQPILARRVEGRLEIVAGERRWRAAKAAGLKDVPVVVREIDDRQSLEIAIIENVQRADLDAVEEALGYDQLIREHGYTQGELAEVLGKSRSHVANTLRLLKLPDSVKAMVSDGRLSASAARTAVTQDDPEAFARRIVEEGHSVRAAETIARGETPAPPPARSRRSSAAGKAPAPATPAPIPEKRGDVRALEGLLSETLGYPVTIELGAEGGRLQLDFRSLSQLDDLCRRLQAAPRRDEDTGPRVRSL